MTWGLEEVEKSLSCYDGIFRHSGMDAVIVTPVALHI
jgi:hypothetical protein